jgi:hypothetical protein
MGIDVMTATTILSEAGWEMSKWQTEHYFVSWLRPCPDNKGSGDKIIGKGRLPTNNRITNAGSQQLTDEQHLCGSAVPSTQNQAGGSGGHQGHGGQASPLGLPHGYATA